MALDLILSNLFTPIGGVFLFPLFPTADFPWEDGTRGIPIIAHLHTIAFVCAILCEEKYLK